MTVDNFPPSHGVAAGSSPPSAPAPVPADLPVVPFEAIASGHREIVIEYRGQQYRLRATRNGKLILNK